MTEIIQLTEEQCHQWLKNINIHPITGKDLDIANNLSLYRKLAKECQNNNIR